MGNKLSISYLMLVVIIFTIILGYIIVKNKKKIIKDNWLEYRCQPIVMPFAGMFGKKTSSNFRYCLWNIFKKFFSFILKPVLFVYKLIFKNIKNMGNTLNSIRKYIFSVRKFIISYIQNLLARIENFSLTLRLTVHKILDILKKQQGIVTASKYILVTIGKMMEVMWNSVRKVVIAIIMFAIALGILLWLCCTAFGFVIVILAAGAGIAFSCFNPETLIELENGKKKKIKDVTLFDTLYNKNKVLGIIETLGNSDNMYMINNIEVSGDHALYEEDKWIRVRDSKYSKKIDKPKIFKLVCLITQDREIYINGNVFSDYCELKEEEDLFLIKEKIKNRINKKICKTENKDKIMSIYGFYEDTKILIYNGEEKKIKDISVGDILYNGEVVTGKIIQKRVSGVNMYKYKNMIISGGQLVYEDEWIYICESNNSKLIECENIETIYNINTNTNNIKIAENLFRDYNELSDEDINTEIDKLSIIKNNKIKRIEK